MTRTRLGGWGQASTLGLVAGLLRGGFALVQHASLRVLLALSGELPLRIGRVLDAGCARSLLRRVGGGHAFVHGAVQAELARSRGASRPQGVEAEHSADPVRVDARDACPARQPGRAEHVAFRSDRQEVHARNVDDAFRGEREPPRQRKRLVRPTGR